MSEDVDEFSVLWHSRDRHLNSYGLEMLNRKQMMIGLPFIHRSKGVCKRCIYGKIHRLPFPKTSSTVEAPLEGAC